MLLKRIQRSIFNGSCSSHLLSHTHHPQARFSLSVRRNRPVITPSQTPISRSLNEPTPTRPPPTRPSPTRPPTTRPLLTRPAPTKRLPTRLAQSRPSTQRTPSPLTSPAARNIVRRVRPCLHHFPTQIVFHRRPPTLRKPVIFPCRPPPPPPPPGRPRTRRCSPRRPSSTSASFPTRCSPSRLLCRAPSNNLRDAASRVHLHHPLVMPAKPPPPP
jgi:hypothetical protein